MWLKMIKCLVSLVILVLVCSHVSTNGGGLCQGLSIIYSGCPDGWTYRGCYSFKGEPAKTWEDAQYYCELDNGSLASLTTNTEVNKIKTSIGGYVSSIDHLYWWVGLKFVSTTSGMSWMWTNGDTYGKVPKWEANSELGAVGQCGLFSAITGNVSSDNCDLERPYICEYEQAQWTYSKVKHRAPSFHPNTLNVQIYENATVGTHVANFSVVDQDSDEHISFSIKTDNDLQLFSISKSTDDVYIIVLNRENLDAETETGFVFDIEATDVDGHSSNMTVNITVLDVNDNVPVCDIQTSAHANRTDGKEHEILRIKDKCTDGDVDQMNRQLQYSLQSESEQCTGAFEIRNTSIMSSSSGQIERIPGPCVFVVVVGDGVHNTKWPLTINLIGCAAAVDGRNPNISWQATDPGVIMRQNCSHKQIGYMTRRCSNTSVYLSPIYNCTKKEIFNLYEELKGGSQTVAVEAFKRLPSLTSTQDGDQLQEGDIITSTAVLSTIAVISANVNISVEESESITDNFMEVVNNLIDKNNTVAMKSLVEHEVGGADRVLAAIDSFAEVMSSRLNTTSKQIIKSNMVLELGLMDDCRYIQFPKKSPELNDTSKNGVKMRCSGDAKNRYAGVYYKNVSEMMPTRMTEQGESKVSAINAAVLSFSVYGDDVKKKLETPIEIVFQLFNESLSVPICSFWNFSTGNDTGAWSESGCWVKGRFPDHVVCACNHLTNFALLMSVSKVKIADKHAAALSVISATGCGLSMMGLFLTVLLYTIYWRTVQSDRSVILLHLCCTLLLAYIVFLTGIQSTESWDLCTTVAVVLHYLLLVVFFLMLVEGLNLAKSILFPLKALNSAFWKRVLILAWVLPALIVFISMAATQLEGYGNTSSCWLSVEGGLIWAFISPVLVIAMINIGIAVAVLKKMFQTVAVKNQTEKTKAWTAIRSICVLMPIMGITWILGVFAVNEHLVGFQYVFAILNSLQGLLIFVFHCAINKKIQKGILLSLRTYRRLPMIKFSSSNKTDTQGTAMTSSKT